MTISSTPRRVTATGNGVATAVPFSFKVFAKTDVLVTVVTEAGASSSLTLDVDYTVALNADQEVSPGGTINFTTPPAANVSIAVIGVMPYDQPTDLPDGGAYRAQVVENAIDRTVIQVQQLAEITDRALRVPIGEFGFTLPRAGERANTVLGFASAGAPVLVDLVDLPQRPTQVENFVATEGQTVFTLANSYVRGVNTLAVYVDGLRVSHVVDYEETTSNIITFLIPRLAGEEVACVIGTGVDLTLVDSLANTYNAVVGLSAAGLVDGQVFYAKGRDTANDGGGGTFTYSAGSVATVDNGIVFAPAVGTGRFLREGYTAAGFNGSVNVLWFGAKVNDSTTVVTTAFQNALNTARPVFVPPTSGFYRTSAGLTGVEGSGLIGYGEPAKIKLIGDTTQSVLSCTGLTNFTLDGVVLDDDEATKTATSKCLLLTNCVGVDIGWLQCINSQSFTVEVNGGSKNKIKTLISEGAATGSGLLLWDTYENNVDELIVESCGGFGLQVFRGSSRNTIKSIVARNTGLEALGITVGCNKNSIGNVYGFNNGDNGISISGEDNQVGTAFIDSPRFHGACFYGMRNQIGTLRTRNVGQASAGVYAAVAGTVQVGGIAADNQVGNLFAWDDQAVPTMGYYAKWNAGSYGPWTTATVYSASTGVVNAGNSYATVAGGTSGATPPTHTSGTVSDGGVLWQYMGAAVSAANRNQVVASKGFGASISPVLDSGTGNKFAVNPQEVDVQAFLAGGTWTKPTGAKKVLVEAVGVGGSSGGGGVFAAAAGGSGGGGGGGALSISQMFDAAELPATVIVTLPAPTGAGTGAGALGPGGNGSQGGLVTFGTFLNAFGGGGGAGGTSATATGGGGSAGVRGSGGSSTGATGGTAGSGGGTAGGAGVAAAQSNNPWTGAAGGGCSATGVAGAGGVALDGCQGGAAGGGLTTGNVASAGANGANWNNANAVTGGAIATAGTTPAAVTHTKGSGGSGGGSGAAASGGAGGAGGFPGGGAGGGGSALDGGGRVGGAGALGGAGLVKVTTYF